MNIKTVAGHKSTRLGVALGLLAASATSAVAAGTAHAATAPSITLSATTGPAAGGNTLTATTATLKFKQANGSAIAGLKVQFQATAAAPAITACNPTSAAVNGVTGVAVAAGAAGYTVVSGTKLGVKVPAGVVQSPNTNTSTLWKFCVYDDNATTKLLGSASYTVYAAPTLDANTPITPAAGPALGGNTVTISDDGSGTFTAATTATIGGVAMTNIVVASDKKSFTAKVPAHAPGAVALVVKTEGGTATRSAGGNGHYVFQNGVTVSPSTMTGTGTEVLDILGAGFSDDIYDWTSAAIDDNKSHVYLVQGAYDPADSTGNKTKGEAAECTGVIVLSDTELACTLNSGDNNNPAFANGGLPDGAYTVVVVNDGGVDVQHGGANQRANDDYSQSIISSTATFTIAPY